MITKAPGIEDIFPDRIDRWNHVLGSARESFRRYNYREIIIPIMEFTEVFSRGLGDETDIVSKEMFTFEDRGGRSLTLRPEGTAGVVRAYCENGEYNRLASCKFFYAGPMFRAEKPQKGRLRQFNQFGAEIFGSDDPFHDAEIISIMNSITRAIGIKDYSILLNSIGCPECRPGFLAALKDYYAANKDELCGDCKRRLDGNTLRLLDCKITTCRTLRDKAPKTTEHLCTSCADHYSQVKSHLNRDGIAFTEDPYLVRGLDYYVKTTFEFSSGALGAQNAFAGGGRYNGLVEVFGGKPTPGVGFAAGIERMILLSETLPVKETRCDGYIIYAGEKARDKGFALANELRNAGLSIDIDPSSSGMKSQMKKAEREKARFAIIIGDQEIDGGFTTFKSMDTGTQEQIPFGELIPRLKDGSVK
jgi:histidyl-tRNA synthetase